MSSDSDDGGNNNLLLTLIPDEKSSSKSLDEQHAEGRTLQNHQQPLEQSHLLQSIPATITTRQLPSQGLSFQLWPAASTLVSLLDRIPPTLLPLSPPPLHILELGSGTGLAGLAAAAILGAHVTLTDLPHVLPNLRFNALANADVVAARVGSVAVRQLVWGDEEDSRSLMISSAASSFNVVMASDVVYYEHLIDPLLRTLGCFVRGEVVFLMAHLRRWKKRDSLFFKKARKLFHFSLVHTDPPSPGSRVGVAVYRFTAKKRAS